MASNEFNKWIHDLNIQMKREKRKILLILDNCPAIKFHLNQRILNYCFYQKIALRDSSLSMQGLLGVLNQNIMVINYLEY
jgi:hypothetical protein